MSGGLFCPVVLDPGALILAPYDFSNQPGYCVVEVQIGWPEVRDNLRPLALGDGTIDDTLFYGSRAITVTFRLDQRWDKTQALLDVLLPLATVKTSQLLGFAYAGLTSISDIRYLEVKGIDAPIVVNGPKYLTVSLSYRSVASPYWKGAVECTTIVPSDPGPEAGRVYDLVFDRVYPAGVGPNTVTITNPGNAPSDWNCSLNGSAVNPEITVNGTTLKFDRNGGVTLTPTGVIYVDTYTRTITDDGGFSLYSQTNFDEWTWDDLKLPPGSSTLTISGTGFDAFSSLLFCFEPYWY